MLPIPSQHFISFASAFSLSLFLRLIYRMNVCRIEYGARAVFDRPCRFSLGGSSMRNRTSPPLNFLDGSQEGRQCVLIWSRKKKERPVRSFSTLLFLQALCCRDRNRSAGRSCAAVLAGGTGDRQRCQVLESSNGYAASRPELWNAYI